MTTALLALLLASGCIEDVGKGKVEAVVEEAAPEPAPKAVGAQTLKVDAARSTLKALGAKVTATHPIEFKSYSGTIVVDTGEVKAINFTTKTAELETDHPKLAEHLLNEDFLFVSAHPEATFRSVSIAAGAEGEGMTHTVQGNLSIRGQTKKVTFPAKIEVKDGEVHANTEFVINRQDFGISYPGRADNLVQDNVVLTVAFIAG